jgi:hypothetical protein
MNMAFGQSETMAFGQFASPLWLALQVNHIRIRNKNGMPKCLVNTERLAAQPKPLWCCVQLKNCGLPVVADVVRHLNIQFLASFSSTSEFLWIELLPNPTSTKCWIMGLLKALASISVFAYVDRLRLTSNPKVRKACRTDRYYVTLPKNLRKDVLLPWPRHFYKT